jgi:hypothetical protein
MGYETAGFPQKIEIDASPYTHTFQHVNDIVTSER